MKTGCRYLSKGLKEKKTGWYLWQKPSTCVKNYKEAYKPTVWLFENQQKNGPYSSRSAQQVFKDAANLLQLPP
jgi:hypothetical protein